MKLAQQQSDFLAAIFSLESNNKQHAELATSAAQGLQVYQYSLLANAKRALEITFATTHSFAGETMFSNWVAEFLKSQKKTHYDWAELGQTFSAFIAQQQTRHASLLSDVASLDYVCHCSERSVDINRDLNSLNLLNEQDAYQLTINYCAGASLLKLSFPVDEVITDISELNEQQTLTLNDIEQQLGQYQSGEYYYLIWRPNFQAQYAKIEKSEFIWLQHWLTSQSDTLHSIKSRVDSRQEDTEINVEKGLERSADYKHQQRVEYPNQALNQALNLPKISIGAALDNVNQEEFSIIEWLPSAIERQLISAIASI